MMTEVRRTHLNPFTEEQVAELRQNPNVLYVSTDTVQFTSAFKAHYCDERRKNVPVKQIFMNAGIDPEVLGESRISGFCYYINRCLRKGRTFEDHRSTHLRQSAGTVNSSEEEVVRLRNEVAYLRQEVEFLKKIRLANLEAQKQRKKKWHQQ